jgi:DNA-binding transcriptional ArsR family regulator
MSAEEALGCQPEDAADLLRALAHPMRLRILCRLLDGECAVAGFESELGLKQPNLSQQLAALREAGLAVTRREAKTVIYRLADDRVGCILAALRSAMAGQPAPAATRRPVAHPATVRPAAEPPPRHSGEAGVFAVTGWNLPTTRGRGG